MPELRIVGAGAANASAELAPPAGPAVNPAELRRLAAAHEAAGFDAVLVATSPTAPDALVVAGELLRATERLPAIVTVSPALVAPTAAARALGTLAALYPGRVEVHLPAVASEADARRDGAPADRGERQRQRAEFAGLLTRTWRSSRPFDHDGEFHQVAGAWSAVRPAAPPPLWVSGFSPAAARLAAEHAGTYLTTGVRIAPTGARLALRLRPIVAATRRAADDYAEQVLRVFRGRAETAASALRGAPGALPGHRGLVGTPDDVAAALLEYHALGVDAVHLAGWRPLADVPLYGQVIAATRGATHSERKTA